MYTEALKSRYDNKIPAHLQKYADNIWNHLIKSSKVVSLKLLPNFEKDHDVSMQYGTDIYKGLVVAVHPDYPLSEKDIMWMHPHAYQCRAIFEGGTFDNVTLPDMQASAGIYNVSSIDDIGTQCNQRYTIVDTHMPFENVASTPKQAYENNNKAQTLTECQRIAEIMGTRDLKEHVFTNMFLRNTTNYVFYNHAFHKEGIVHISPLMGYRTVSSDSVIAADCLNENDYVDVENMSNTKKIALFEKCNWEGDNPINTYALRTPFDTMNRVGTHFRLVKGNFAKTPIHAHMTTENIFKLSATLNNLKLERFGKYIEDQHIRLPVKHSTVIKLIQQGELPIINPEFTDAHGDLIIPRHIVEQLF
tara:strand:- start:925 stop:2007 length:1083 start_codon:yes stop_codon:yes gene_type:complete